MPRSFYVVKNSKTNRRVGKHDARRGGVGGGGGGGGGTVARECKEHEERKTTICAPGAAESDARDPVGGGKGG